MLRVVYLVDCLLTLLVLLGLLLHLLPLFNVVDEREEVAQVDDERLRLDETGGEGRKRMWRFKGWISGEGCREGEERQMLGKSNTCRQAGGNTGGRGKKGKSSAGKETQGRKIMTVF